ncbi:DNA-binding PadR family transcriptional regulator [Motilibacter rhizosphaerae]|uniref:DNA-binding PadR family transcriptional regulator n=1 Tax=Motilibacter rhizosphaerae TaxID=598652 RepID=A0A4Q7NR02_9ACTN|nr:PadR family transcriptional regulator [Motilibacter rhizosphaerae]RZS87040.1 DNA-binding PadR family transcriptional regulator [Motilibacter rhizosphaerae]
MARRRVSNPLALAVLSCLTERPMHPYEISTTLRSRGKEQSIKLNYGSLYSVVESLTKHGLVRPLETARDGRRPERTVYEITPAGTAECEDWLAELLSTPQRDYTSLEAGLSLLPLLEPDEVARLLDGRCERLRIEIRALDAAHAETQEMRLPELFVIESLYRLAMLQAELAFVTDLARRIRSDELGGSAGWRRMHELRASGMSFADILGDPVATLGEEARALQTGVPRQKPL